MNLECTSLFRIPNDLIGCLWIWVPLLLIHIINCSIVRPAAKRLSLPFLWDMSINDFRALRGTNRLELYQWGTHGGDSEEFLRHISVVKYGTVVMRLLWLVFVCSVQHPSYTGGLFSSSELSVFDHLDVYSIFMMVTTIVIEDPIWFTYAWLQERANTNEQYLVPTVVQQIDSVMRFAQFCTIISMNTALMAQSVVLIIMTHVTRLMYFLIIHTCLDEMVPLIRPSARAMDVYLAVRHPIAMLLTSWVLIQIRVGVGLVSHTTPDTALVLCHGTSVYLEFGAVLTGSLLLLWILRLLGVVDEHGRGFSRLRAP